MRFCSPLCVDPIHLVFDDGDVLGSWPFWTLPNGELYLLTFAKVIETNTLHCRAVEKQVFVAAVANETKTFVRKTLNGAFHLLITPVVGCLASSRDKTLGQWIPQTL